MGLFELFRMSLYLLITLSGLMLAYAEGSLSPQMAMPIVTLLAFLGTERSEKLALPIWIAGGLGLLAFGLAIAEVVLGDLEARILSGAHLITYITWIVLFTKKDTAQYWLLLAFSALMVALGSLLSDSAGFGGLLLLFILLAIWTLSVFTLHLGRRMFDRAEASGQLDSDPAVGHISLIGAKSEVRASVQHDPDERWISIRFVGGYFLTCLATMLMAGVFFMYVPHVKLGGSTFANESIRGREQLTGFSKDVSLGDIGEILESAEPVMRVTLKDPVNDEELSLDAHAQRHGFTEPLFRGGVMNEYRNGKWSSSVGDRLLAKLPRTPRRSRELYVLQRVELEPIGTDTLFAMTPVSAGFPEGSQVGIGYQRISMQFRREAEGGRPKKLTYVLWTRRDPMDDDTNPPRLPRQYSSNRFLQPYLQFPSKQLPRLRALAAEVTAPTEQRPNPTDFDKMQMLLGHLQSSGKYGYTLKLSVEDSTIDPLEDFLFNRRTGHCEYFASALAMMLRSQGIPSRMVNGFKGGVAGKFSKAIEVQQRHAHAWVEAYSAEHQQWMILDPTPAARDEGLDVAVQSEPWHQQLSRLFRDFWNGEITSLSFEEQRRRFYEPIRETAVAWWAALSGDREKLKELWANFIEFLKSPERWISISGGLLTFFLLLFLVGLWYGLKSLRHLVGYLRGKTTAGRKRRQVAFYERFRTICRQHGFERKPSETAAEFAASLTKVVRERTDGEDDLGTLPGRLVTAFYEVRYGQQVLADHRLSELSRGLNLFEERLNTRASESTAGAGQ